MKKIFLISILAGGIYLATKVNVNLKALEGITAKIKRITSFNIQSGFIILKIDLNLTNLSDFNLGIDTFDLVSIKQLRFYNAINRKLIGSANVNITNVILPSKKTLILTDIIAKIPTKNILNHISLFTSKTGDNVKVVPVFYAAGKEFEINPENFI